jgi:hypothetical protein
MKTPRGLSRCCPNPACRFSGLFNKGNIIRRFLFTTDGFEMYEWAVKKLPAGVCIYGQVIKTRRENRVIRVDRKLLLGMQTELEELLFHSEDSKTLNTSFVECHNLKNNTCLKKHQKTVKERASDRDYS